jgi:SAM-dependent methyltransferase
MDAGCGSGRDAKYFLSQGYEVYAFDSAAELARLAGNFLGQKVHNHGFLDLVVENDFDGIWACASLLHLNSVELSKSLDRLLKSLKPGGVFYCSFKYGEFEGERGGRYFIDMNENRFINLTEELCCEIVEMWITTDVRPNLQEQKWLNIILKKS